MRPPLPWVFLALRLAIGGLLIFAGVLKAHDGAAATATTIAGYRILPPAIVAPLGFGLPYFEILLGGYLALGLFMRVAAWIATVQFSIFAIAVASLVLRNLPADCGCFGSSIPTPPSWGHVAGDVALALATLVLAVRGPGAFALDGMLRGGGDDGVPAEASQPL